MYQDMSELSDGQHEGQHKIQTLQSQQLAELPEDSHYYRELLTELEQAREQAKLSPKQKLIETAEKFENSTLVASNPSEGGSVLCPSGHAVAGFYFFTTVGHILRQLG